jgi:hypothetical protein
MTALVLDDVVKDAAETDSAAPSPGVNEYHRYPLRGSDFRVQRSDGIQPTLVKLN